MTRYLCAPDSFKESLSADQVAQAMAQGIRRADDTAEIRCLPMADGGEGTARVLVRAGGGTLRSARVHDPFGKWIQAEYGLLDDGGTAVVEVAAASGLTVVDPDRRDPKLASSRGTGELIEAAVDAGAQSVIVALGGSVTNDAGAGLLQALGARLLDDNGEDLAPGGIALANLAAIDTSGMDARLAGISFITACDVTNPLIGNQGASAVFGRQKGMRKDDVELFDAALGRFGTLTERVTGVSVNDVAGMGAAGGIGAALCAFLHAESRNGIDLVIERTGLDAAVRWADVIFTGEGSIDEQTRYGKTPQGVAKTAQRHDTPVIAIAGCVGDGIEPLYGSGIEAIFGIAPGAATLQELLSDASANLIRTSEQIVRVMRIATWQERRENGEG